MVSSKLLFSPPLFHLFKPPSRHPPPSFCRPDRGADPGQSGFSGWTGPVPTPLGRQVSSGRGLEEARSVEALETMETTERGDADSMGRVTVGAGWTGSSSKVWKLEVWCWHVLGLSYYRQQSVNGIDIDDHRLLVI